MIKKNIIPGLIILSVFFSCSKKDTVPDETCYDKIKNQNELLTDCGGVCRPCPQIMTAKINGTLWEADTAKITSSFSNGGSKFLLKGNTKNLYPQISLVYIGPFSIGDHILDHSSSFTQDINSPLPASVTSGTVTISEMDTRGYLISGSFSFTSSDGTNTYTITEGVFTNVKYALN